MQILKHPSAFNQKTKEIVSNYKKYESGQNELSLINNKIIY